MQLKPLTLEVTDEMLSDLNLALEYLPISGDVYISSLDSFLFGDPKVQLLGLAKSYLNEHGFSHSDLEDFLLYRAHDFNRNPVLNKLTTSWFWDSRDRITELTDKIMHSTNAREVMYLRKWLHQTLALAFNNDDKPYGAAGVLVFHGNKDVAPLLEKLTFASDEQFLRESFTEKAWFNPKDTHSLTSTWITELDGIYPEAKSFLLAREDMHRPLFAKVDMPKARRTSFCVSVKDLTQEEINGLDPIFWPVKTDNLDMDQVAALDEDWVRQLWVQVNEELYAPNPMGFTLFARPEQENSALKFFATQMRLCKKDECQATMPMIYEAYKDWCQQDKTRIAKDDKEFFTDIADFIGDLFYETAETDDGICIRYFTLR